MLNDVELEVGEVFHAEVVVGQDPQRAANVVSDLTIFNAFVLKHSVEDIHAAFIDELLGELVGLEEEH